MILIRFVTSLFILSFTSRCIFILSDKHNNDDDDDDDEEEEGEGEDKEDFDEIKTVRA